MPNSKELASDETLNSFSRLAFWQVLGVLAIVLGTAMLLGYALMKLNP